MLSYGQHLLSTYYVPGAVWVRFCSHHRVEDGTVESENFLKVWEM